MTVLSKPFLAKSLNHIFFSYHADDLSPLNKQFKANSKMQLHLVANVLEANIEHRDENWDESFVIRICRQGNSLSFFENLKAECILRGGGGEFRGGVPVL